MPRTDPILRYYHRRCVFPELPFCSQEADGWWGNQADPEQAMGLVPEIDGYGRIYLCVHCWDRLEREARQALELSEDLIDRMKYRGMFFEALRRSGLSNEDMELALGLTPEIKDRIMSRRGEPSA